MTSRFRECVSAALRPWVESAASGSDLTSETLALLFHVHGTIALAPQ